MEWINLESEEQLQKIMEESLEQPVMIFKHSTRCSISSMALSRLNSQGDNKTAGVLAYYLDLIQYRAISNKVADDFHVFHESPQVILIKNKEVVYDASHLEISWNHILESLNAS